MVYCLRRCEKIPWVQFVLFLGPYKMVRQVKKVDYRANCALRFLPHLGGINYLTPDHSDRFRDEE